LPRWNGLPFVIGALPLLVLIANPILNSTGTNNSAFDFLFPDALIGLSVGSIFLGYLVQGNAGVEMGGVNFERLFFGAKELFMKRRCTLAATNFSNIYLAPKI
jgi:hypothetical protein